MNFLFQNVSKSKCDGKCNPVFKKKKSLMTCRNSNNFVLLIFQIQLSATRSLYGVSHEQSLTELVQQAEPIEAYEKTIRFLYNHHLPSRILQ